MNAPPAYHAPSDQAGATSGLGPLVSVVITCYNQAHFLDEAIQSALAQTYQAVEILVVDDGSTDNTGGVARQYADEGVRYVGQPNQGLSTARNTGIRESTGAYLIFLDADDRLLPRAAEAGLACLGRHQAYAFASGACAHIDRDGRRLPSLQTACPEEMPYLALLRGNYIGMHATILYRRAALEQVGSFDVTLPACEDYELYLRIARNHPIGCHQEVVAEYRMHGDNMSRNTAFMLKTVLRVLRSQWPFVKEDQHAQAALKQGLRNWQAYYGPQLVRRGTPTQKNHSSVGKMLENGITLVVYAPEWVLSNTAKRLRRMANGVLKQGPSSVLQRQRLSPPVGRVRFGSLRRVVPFSRSFGYDRGKPVDRYYIEQFLKIHAGDIRRRVLEVGDNTYTMQFGGKRVTKSDVLHVAEGNPQATFVGDITTADHLPSDAFDCVILTQTLHLIYDVRAAVVTLRRILRPGGVLLATVPGLSHIDHGEWGGTWYWSFTTQSMQRLFEQVFPASNVHVKAFGNVLSAVGFLYGLARSELRRRELDVQDPDYQVIITIRVVKEARPS